MAPVLITQCLQRDFVDPIGPHDPLPNLLHVGYSEAARLLGPDPAAGPLAQVIQWARGLPSAAIDIDHHRAHHRSAPHTTPPHTAHPPSPRGTKKKKPPRGAGLLVEVAQGPRCC